MTQTDRYAGLVGNTGIKAPVRVAATSAITLSGLQTLDGVSLAADDRVLAMGQPSSIDNGIYVVSSSAWTRALDCDGARDIVGGTLVSVAEGTLRGTQYAFAGSGALTPGTDALTFTAGELVSSNIHAATTKAVPVDADEFGYWDSVSAALRKLTWANIKTAILLLFSVSGGSALIGFIQSGVGAVATTLQAKGRERPSVEDFGAVGDGVADDTAAFVAARVLNKPVYLTSGKTYAISAQIAANADGQGFICEGLATVLMLSGTNEFDRSDYTGTQFDADACGFYINGYDNYTFKGIHVKFETIAAVRTAKALAIRDSMNSHVDIECSLFQETQGGIVVVDSCGQNTTVKAYVHDCGTSNDTLATMQITGVAIDDNKVGSVNTTHSKVSCVARNIIISGAALTKYGNQTDAVNVAGTGDKPGLYIDVDADTVAEPFDCFGSFVQANVRGKTCQTGVKLIHGAQHCKIDAVIDGTDGAAVWIYGTSTGTQETAYNRVNCVASNIGTVGSTLTNFAVAIDGAGETYKPSNNHVTVLLKNTGNLSYAADILAGTKNLIEYKTDSTQDLKFAGVIRSTAGAGNKIEDLSSNNGDQVTGRKYAFDLLNTSSTTALALSANTLYAIPMIVRTTQTFTTATVRISTGAAGNMRIGLYKWQGGVPTSLISDFGTISTAATGEIDLSLFSGAGISLTPGVYAIAIVCDAAPSVYSTSANVQLMSIVGVATMGAADCQISRAFTYAALPATWGTPSYGTGNIPNVILRF